MISLKAFCEELAPLTGSTQAALYERQRALVRMGILPEPVKGRGHGLPATPETVGALLTAMMVTDNLSETDVRVHQLANMRARPRCGFTRKVVFADAFAAILSSEELASRVVRIRVFRAELAAQIYFSAPGDGVAVNQAREPEVTLFGRLRDFPDRMEVEASLWGPVVERIQFLLRKAQQTGEQKP